MNAAGVVPNTTNKPHVYEQTDFLDGETLREWRTRTRVRRQASWWRLACDRLGRWAFINGDHHYL